ncbi:hypothetical protein CAPTEDRAFT_170446 [Capitella teleta]|uniref:TAFII55 protein conserved region domain-containing protein n=1 Tax=Capitella teleta TaxID=283909 RepID=R7V1P7_CAPTE|nr:hypothetical protein CAPTEDRAFT_170446 [Capitella teleta]|eukprot:ELU12768.1 hypothetical protein CAPTEDRAFT_170446 [Capitella teleta]
MSKAPARPVIKKKDDGVHDLEQQFILRLPPGPSMALRHDVEAGAMNLKDKLAIEFQPDMRHGKVTYGGEIMNAKLVDLPTVVECLKTTDKKNFYKTSDISQMLICGVDDDDESDNTESGTGKRKDKDKKFQYGHGISPSLKNVRKRRFRKTLKKKYQEQPDTEKEVKQLFRMDNEAIDVKWEVVVEEEKAENQSGGDKQVLAQGESNIMDDDEMQPPAKPLEESSNVLEVAEHEIFGDVSSSEEEDLNIMDSGGEDTNMSFPRVDTKDSLASFDANESLGEDGDLESKLQELRQQMESVRQERMQAQLQAYEMGEDSQDGNLQDLMQTEQKLQQEYEILSSMVNQN